MYQPLVKRHFTCIQFWMIALCCVINVSFCKAQQSPQHSLYMIDKYQINPAYAGFDRSLSANFNYRSQWSGLNGSPRQAYFNAHLPIYLLDGGLGVTFRSDKAGTLGFTEFTTSYNRVLSMRNGILSGGVRLGFIQRTNDGVSIITPDGFYNPNAFNHNDPILSEGITRGTNLVWTIGIYFSSNKFNGGVTLSDFYLGDASVGDATVASNKMASFMGQLSILVNELQFKPSLLVKTNGQYYQTDLSIIGKSGNIFGGLGIRGFNENSFESLIILGGIKLNKHYTLTYSYDMGLGSLKNASQGSHEININYNLNKLIGIGLAPEIIYNPRNL